MQTELRLICLLFRKEVTYSGCLRFYSSASCITQIIKITSIIKITVKNEPHMISELKAFLFRADVLALAVAFIIAGAFQKIIDSVVNDVISPIIAMIVGTPDFSSVMIGSIKIGNLITTIINFLIVGIVLFMIIKAADKKTEDVK